MDKKQRSVIEYAIGIDLGHGETSAALCPIQWDTEVEQLDPAIDLEMGGNKYVLPSAITILPNGNAYIGDAAFAPEILRQAKVRVCFKQAPRSIDGEAEKLMIRYMKEVYARILQNNVGRLTPTNHLVYIATPSGWGKETQSLYLKMAECAGLPVGGVTKESRAAFVRAQNDVTSGIGRNIENGAIVFDMGSSTLDFTYMRKGLPTLIDHGYDCGASFIEKAIFKEKENEDESIKLFERKYPELVDSLLFEARKVKESVYFDPTLRVKKTINFDDIVEDEELEDERFKLAFLPGELDEMLRKKGYIDMVRKAMMDYREKYIPGEKIFGVFMTGGASRMEFLKDLICECWGVEKNHIFRDNDPSLTISQGVAEVARMDLRTEGMDEGLQEEISRLENSDDIYHSFIDIFSNEIYENVTGAVSSVINEFRFGGSDYSINQLKSAVDEVIATSSQEVVGRATDFLEMAVMNNLADIQKKVESIVKNYARNDATVGNINLSSVSIPTISSIDMGNTMSDISNSISSSSEDWGAAIGGAAIGGAIAFLLGGPLAWLIGIGAFVADVFFGKTEEEKRAEAMNRPLSSDERGQVVDSIVPKWEEMTSQMWNSILSTLSQDQNVRVSINKAVKQILNEYKERLKDARILID